MGRPFDSPRSNYAVTNYHTELLQMIIALELDNLNVSNYSLTFDDYYSLLKLDVTDQSTDYFFILDLCKGPLQNDLMLAYLLKGMALLPRFC